MGNVPRPLPDFEKPPLEEVVLGVQFNPLESLRAAQLGYLWKGFRDRFPKTEEHPLLDPVTERFGPDLFGPSSGLRFLPNHAVRLWFVDPTESELIQVQHDRFIRNWRKAVASAAYPRFNRLLVEFERDFGIFSQLIAEEGWGKVDANQCEVTYVNMVYKGEDWPDIGDIGSVIKLFGQCDMGIPEEGYLGATYLMAETTGKPFGRLRITAEPAVRVNDHSRALRITITARGKPDRPDMPGVLRFFNLAHERVVRAFADVTTLNMHQAWGRRS